MDATGFDWLSRAIVAQPSRRGLVRLLVGTLLGAPPAFLASDIIGAKKKRGKGKKGKRKRTRRCTPSCAASKPCGSDGCGGVCGSCVAPETCQGGQCRCVPDCTGKTCDDDDGCGTSCEECAAPRTCQSGLCTCPAGQDDCGGDCVPACAATQARIPGTCDQCCTRNDVSAVECDTAAEVSADCCSGKCDDDGVCRGKAPGAPCDFDAQCFSGECNDSGLNVGKCD